MASSAHGPRRRRPSPRPLGQCPESAEWPRLELVVARPLAEIAAPSGERSNQRERRLRLLAAQLMLKSLLDDLGEGDATLIRNPAGTLQQLGVHFDGLSAIQPCLDSTAAIPGNRGAACVRAQSRVGLVSDWRIYWRIAGLAGLEGYRGQHPRCPANGSSKPPQQKTPRRGGERLLGLLQGGEIFISIYVDPWEVGGPFDVPLERHRGRR